MFPHKQVPAEEDAHYCPRNTAPRHNTLFCFHFSGREGRRVFRDLNKNAAPVAFFLNSYESKVKQKKQTMETNGQFYWKKDINILKKLEIAVH